MLSKSRRGKLFILSAPSGAGKTTLCNHALKNLTEVIRSVSYTTRKRRRAEVDGADYHFISDDEFKRMIAEGRFAEWAIVHGNHYGTDQKFIDEQMASGIDVLLNIDVQGGDQLTKKIPDAVTIFIHTPSFEELKRRLMGRNSDTQGTIEKRLREAEKELQASKNYQFHVINDEFERASNELIKIIEAQRDK